MPSSASGETINFKQTLGFGQAELTTAGGEKSLVYIPLSSLGFGSVVPVFRREEDIDSPGAQPLLISVDNVQMIRAHATGQYLEHMVVKGRRRHQLAVRVLDGPVELFSYTQVQPNTGGPLGFQAAPQASVKCQWYIRRQGQLVEVVHGGFTKQMAAYFHDDPVVVEALASRSVGYDDMKMLVQMYNQHQTPVADPTK
ncbi:hypothetical protein GCM10022409_28750 [Hymenobacter glaciei]|uniref:Uncharacterized protein n=2 Tax=Hymenobacter glaciei TaxID=877209 RepID=A0ABP7UDT2_9BACT